MVLGRGLGLRVRPEIKARVVGLGLVARGRARLGLGRASG